MDRLSQRQAISSPNVELSLITVSDERQMDMPLQALATSAEGEEEQPETFTPSPATNPSSEDEEEPPKVFTPAKNPPS